MKRYLIALILMVVMAAPASAQDDPEYRMEIGAAAGMMGYLGDFNGSPTRDLQPMGSAFARYVFNPYMGLRLMASYGKMKGSSADVDTYYDDYKTEPYEFSNSAIDLGITYEYNFWPYGTGRDYRGAQRLTPFVMGGLRMTLVKTNDKTVVAPNIPIGLGLKYKIGDRLNVGIEWAMHFAMSDKLDGVADPYGIKSSGAFKNTDCFTTMQLTISYSFSAKCATCNKE